MRLIKIFSVVIPLFLVCALNGQSITIQSKHAGNKVSIRGLSVVDDETIWVSGNNGMIGRSIDGGANFIWKKVPGFEKRDFRDIEAFDQNTAIIMGVDAPAILLKTMDGGNSWLTVLSDSTKGMFLDAMDFSDEMHGIVIGDPIDQKVYLAATNDQGETWKRIEWVKNPTTLTTNPGEAFFASSGTNIKLLKKDFAFVSGGLNTRIFYRNQWQEIPLMKGKESTGANSIAIFNQKNAVIVGGDFSKDTISTLNCVLLKLGRPIEFSFPVTAPHGYRSCVTYIHENVLVACGTSGVDVSMDAGKNWKLISTEGFHVVQKSKKGTAVFLAGSNGRIATLSF